MNSWFVSVVTKPRRTYLFLASVTIAAGLIVHLAGDALGAGLRDVTGDALWAAMMLWLISALLPHVRVFTRALTAYGVCVAVEYSQLVHMPTLNAIRSTRVGHLVLGSDFDARDLAAYCIGVSSAFLIAMVLERTTVSASH